MSIELKDKLVTLESLGVVYDSEVNDRNAAIAAEATARADAISAEIAARTEAIANEVTARNAAIVEAINQAETGAPTKVELVSQMTNPDKNYLYIGEEQGYNSGHIYYLVDGAPVDKGVFGGTNIDDTLTISGQAADAKVTGDKIEEIKEDLSPLNTGDYVYAEFTLGYYIRNDGTTVNLNSPVKNANQRYCILSAEEGDKFYLNVGNGSAARGYCFIDASNTILEVAAFGVTLSGVIITAPENSVKVVINDNLNEGHYAYRVNSVIKRLNQIDDEIDILQEIPIFKTGDTYNLVNFSDMLYNKMYYPSSGKYTDNETRHTIKGLIPVEPGQILTSSKHIDVIDYFTADKTYLSSITDPGYSSYHTFVTPANAYYFKPQWGAYSSNALSGLKDGELADVYIVDKYGAQSVRHLLKPKTQIDGRYISDSFFESATPAEKSNLDITYKCREIKRQNRERGAVRLASFNIYGAMIKYANWPTVKMECTQYGIDACGFQEVADSNKFEDGTPRHSFSRSMMGEAFKYSNVGDTDPDGVGIRILSGLEITSGEFTPYEYTYTSGGVTYNESAGYSHAIIKIPNYHHARAWDKKISMYTCHFSTIKIQSIGMLEHLATVIAADTSEYKVFVADTNCFSIDAETGEPWIWKYFKAMGLYPAATDFTKSSYCYPISQEEWNKGVLDFIDNVFCTDNMRCINWGIVDSQDYPIAGVSGGYVSDHCMLYADMIFDFVDGFSGT